MWEERWERVHTNTEPNPGNNRPSSSDIRSSWCKWDERKKSRYTLLDRKLLGNKVRMPRLPPSLLLLLQMMKSFFFALLILGDASAAGVVFARSNGKQRRFFFWRFAFSVHAGWTCCSSTLSLVVTHIAVVVHVVFVGRLQILVDQNAHVFRANSRVSGKWNVLAAAAAWLPECSVLG